LAQGQQGDGPGGRKPHGRRPCLPPRLLSNTLNARGRREDVLTLPVMPLWWHTRGMPRTRVSTTVDHDLLKEARSRTPGLNDAALLDAALKALLARYRAAEIDAAYAAYDTRPLDEPDEWGDLASFREAASAS
jgi:hypothetical protein